MNTLFDRPPLTIVSSLPEASHNSTKLIISNELRRVRDLVTEAKYNDLTEDEFIHNLMEMKVTHLSDDELDVLSVSILSNHLNRIFSSKYRGIK